MYDTMQILKCSISFIKAIVNCTGVPCTKDLKICPDGTRAPIPIGGCCPSLSACKTHPIERMIIYRFLNVLSLLLQAL